MSHDREDRRHAHRWRPCPCLSSAVGGLIERYSQVAPDVRIIAYLDGYAGLLTGRSVEVTPAVREQAHLLHQHGGSPIGNSRVKLTNVADCVRRGLVQEGQDPLHVAAEQLTKDGVDVLHTIGGDDTNTTAADLAAYLHENAYELTVVGLAQDDRQRRRADPSVPGAWTAAEQGSIFAQNIIAEHSSNPRMLIVHEVMGRNCGWLTERRLAATTSGSASSGSSRASATTPLLGRPRRLRAEDPSTSGRGGAPQDRHGRDRVRQHLPQ